MKKGLSITAVIIAKDEERMIENCINTLKWCDQVMVIDPGSQDRTAEIAEALGAKVIGFEHQSFARLRNKALQQVTTEWIFYIDADERVVPALAKEIMVQLETSDSKVFSFARQNICYGKKLSHGGWSNDQVTRLFAVDNLEKWTGSIHESPVFSGEASLLVTPLIHLTHRNTTDGLKKTISWTKVEAQLLYKADCPKVTFLTLIRKGSMEFLRRGIFQRGYRDGVEGLIEAVVQGINRVLVYIQVWELQQKPSLEDKYQRQEEDVNKLWSEEK